MANLTDKAGTIEHASCVAFGAKAILIRGASGSGKSSLALELMGLGAQLVADDRVCLRRGAQHILARPPETLEGLIEARGVGLLKVPFRPAPLSLIVDLDQVETRRFPEKMCTEVLGLTLPFLKKVESPIFGAALAHLIQFGRIAP